MGHLNPRNVSNSSQNPLGGASHRCPKKCQYQTSMRYLIGVHLTELRTPQWNLLSSSSSYFSSSSSSSSTSFSSTSSKCKLHPALQWTTLPPPPPSLLLNTQWTSTSFLLIQEALFSDSVIFPLKLKNLSTHEKLKKFPPAPHTKQYTKKSKTAEQIKYILSFLAVWLTHFLILVHILTLKSDPS